MLKKGKTKAIMYWVCLCIISISMCGCSAKDHDESESNDGTAKGRYLEAELKLPEGADVIQDVCRMADGSIRMAAGDSDDKGGIWDTKDGGETWNKKLDYPKEITDVTDFSLESVLLSDKGDILLEVGDYSQATGENYKEGMIKLQLWKMDEKGVAKQLEVTDTSNEPFNRFFDEWKFTDEGQVVGRDTQGKIYQMPMTIL